MSNLVIDIGNSRTKVAVFNNRQLLHHEETEHLSADNVAGMLESFNVTDSIVSAVGPNNSDVIEVLQKKTKFVQFSHRLPATVKLGYKTPGTLGLDRLAAVIGAMAVNKGENSLVIDCGTCITIDSVTNGGEYSGGSISPGLAMRLRALHTFTEKLPLVSFDSNFTGWRGQDTSGSILSGVLQGAFYEVMGFIQEYVTAYADLQVLLCGGDSNFFDTRLKNSIFAHIVKTEPTLVLTGLNEVIHHYND
jgi:type III pantothenate kinase